MVNANMSASVMSLFVQVALMPEAIVTLSALLFLVGGVFASNPRTDRMIIALSVFMLVTLCGLTVMPNAPDVKLVLFSHMFVYDGFSRFCISLLLIGTAFSFLLSTQVGTRGDVSPSFEFSVLMLLSLLGMMVMVSAGSLMSLYVGLELTSLPLYVLAAFNRDHLRSTEAGLKYFVLGALASGITLFGMSLIYGFAGTMNFDALASLFSPETPASPGVVIGLVLVIIGLCFKVSAAPFHMWTPDVYEGAPTAVTAFFAIAPKFAAMGLFVRLLTQPFGALVHDWRQVIEIVSVASMLVGAFGALTQTNIKRLLAYSSIGHIGYALIGLAAAGNDGVSSVLIYFTLYVFMTAGAFACVMMMRRGGEAVETIADLAGLSRTRQGMAFSLAVLMFSMAGIPPFSGFFGKLYVFLAAMHSGLDALAIIGVVTSVVACYYYLRIVKLMYFDEPVAPFDTQYPAPLRWVLFFSTLVTLLFTFYPTPLVDAAKSAAEALFR